MLKRQARLVALLVFVADLALVATAFGLAHWARSAAAPALGLVEAGAGLYPLGRYLPLLPLALVLWATLLASSGRYRSHRRVSLAAEASAIVRVTLAGAAGFALAVWAFRLDERLLGDDRISRAWIAMFALFAGALLLAEKTALRIVARRLRERGFNYRTILLVGSGPTARAVARTVREHRWWGYRLLGTLELDGEGEPFDASLAPRLGEFRDLTRVLSEHVVDEVVFAVAPRDLERFEESVLALQDQGILVRYALDLLPHAKAHVELEEIDGVPLVTLSTSPTGLVALVVKRMFDVGMAAVLLALTAPAIVTLALLIRIREGSPVLFRQRRCGVHGRQFTLLKFRTMVAGAESLRHEIDHLNEMDGPVFKARRDPRVTPLGRHLRKWSLDELPQLWNVLRGDMSLVGPRPPLPEEVASYERWQRRRLAMKPGLTGLWQVSGRNQVDFGRWMELDLEYIDEWSLWLDLKILLRTVPVVLSGRGAS